MSLLPALTGSFSTPAVDNPTVAMMEAAYAHHGIDARYINCDVAAADLTDAVRGATAMGWIGFNCSLPHKVAVIELLDELAESARLIGAVNCAVRGDGGWIGENPMVRAFSAHCARSPSRRDSGSSFSALEVRHARSLSNSHLAGQQSSG